MEIGIRWARGFFKIHAESHEPIQSFVKRVADRLKVDPRMLILYKDEPRTESIPVTGPLMNARIHNKNILYLKINGIIPKAPVGTKTDRIDPYKDYLAPGEEMTSEMKRIQSEFGPRAISTAFFEHRESLKPKISIQDESSCYAIRIGEEALKRFQAVALQSKFSSHRMCFLFGRINQVTGKVTIHTACEPPQKNEADVVEVQPGFDMHIPVSIAKYFGMKCCGMAISHLPNSKYPMTSYMIKLAAYYQNFFGEYFTTLVVTPEGDSNVQIEAFQVSDVAMRLEREHYIIPNDDQTKLYFKEELYVGNRKQSNCDVNVFLCAVRVRLTHSKFVNHSFPFPSQNPSNLDLKVHFGDNEFCPPWWQLFDFNLLIYLVNMNIFSLNDEIPMIIDAIITKSEIPERFLNKIYSIIEAKDTNT